MPNFVHTKVDPSRLRTTADNIDSTLDRLENAFREVDSALHNTLYPTWKDVASTLFFQKYSADTSVFAAQMKAFRALNEQLRDAAGIFDSADSKANDLVKNLKIG